MRAGHQLAWAATMMVAAQGAIAQTTPLPPLPPIPGSVRVLVVDYVEDQVIRLQGMPGYQIAIEFAGDERIENVALGDSGAWQATANKRGDHLFLKPVQGGVSTNMVVVTDRRLYTFELSPFTGSTEQLVYAVRFRFPAAASADATEPAVARVEGQYRLSGDRAVRPSALSDDGVHTYAEWPANVALPAIYAVDGEGREILANGAMRDGLYVIDSVAARLVFRRDKQVAYARRFLPKAR